MLGGWKVSKNKLTIQICGIRYPITTLEEPAYVAGLAQEIDAAVRDMMKTGSVSINEALVLCALSYLDEKKKVEATTDNLRTQITGYVEEAAKARLEAQGLRREAEQLRGKLEQQ